MEENVQKKRRLHDDDADDGLQSLNDDLDYTEPEQQTQKVPDDPSKARIAKLEGSLQHLREWMQTVQQRIQSDPARRDSVFNARRVFVGGVPLGTADDDLSNFLCNAIKATGAATSATGRPIIFCRVQPDKMFAFIELRSAEEASNVMGLDGLVYKDNPLKIKRPSNYDAEVSLALGPPQPDPSMDLSKVLIRVEADAAGAGDTAPAATGRTEATLNTLYIGGLPTEWGHDQCMELLQMYGEVKYFKLMMDRTSGKSRGFGFAEYTTDASTLAALAALNGAQLGSRRIIANRMLEHKQKQQQMSGTGVSGKGQWAGLAGRSTGGNTSGAPQAQQWSVGSAAAGGMASQGSLSGTGGTGYMTGVGVQTAAGASMGGYMAGGPGGMMMPAGNPSTAAAAGGIQQGAAGGFGSAGYSIGMQQPGSLSGMGAAVGGSMGMQQGGMLGGVGAAAASGMGSMYMNGAAGMGAGLGASAGGHAAGMGMAGSQVNMYGMQQQSGYAAGGYASMYGSNQLQQAAAMYGGQMLDQQHMQQQGAGTLAASGAAGVAAAAAAAAAAGGAAGSYSQQEQMQSGYTTGMPAALSEQQGGAMPSDAAGLGGAIQPAAPTQVSDYATAAVAGTASIGSGTGGLPAWQDQQQQQAWMQASSQPMQGWG